MRSIINGHRADIRFIAGTIINVNNSLFQLNTPSNGSGEVQGVVERITFQNEETGFAVARLAPEGGGAPVTILGVFSNIFPGEFLRCSGTWVRHPQWGLQMQVSSSESIRPATSHGIRKYLGSGMVKGIGPVMAGRIVDKFGEKSLEIIECSPNRLAEIDGIGEKRIDMIRSAWNEHREIRNVMLFLQSNNVSPTFAVRIFKAYGGDAISIVENNPYRLASDIWGIAFKKADMIARNLGVGEADPRRIEAGIIYVLRQAIDNYGHLFLTRNELTDLAESILGTREIEQILASMIERDILTAETMDDSEAIYLPALLALEKDLASAIAHLAQRPMDIGISDASLASRLRSLTSSGAVRLSEEQTQAAALCVKSRIAVLTGGPGTGKTTTTRAIVDLLRSLGKHVLLASPTGRAAKRLSEAAGADAKTIHRMLGYDPSTRQFKFNATAPLDCDALIVDEASMLDINLAFACISALPDHAQILLVGDMDQLPSVGPGNVLRDIIGSDAAPIARLTEIFRQAALSAIVTNAHAINQGKFPRLSPPKDRSSDMVYVAAEEAEDVASRIVAVVANSLPKRGYALDDIQVLAPMQKGPAGAMSLNEKLQARLNPPEAGKPEARIGSRLFRLGDRVIQLRNNYDKGIFNGEIGAILSINDADSTLVVHYQDQNIQYDFHDLDELGLAYCLTVHKSQGSEFPVAVIAVHTQHYALLQRNLLYTAITRAKRFAVLVGSRRAVEIAVRNDKIAARNTRLRQRIRAA
jgi:exodeoxyribonuclease V alpha subunit